MSSFEPMVCLATFQPEGEPTERFFATQAQAEAAVLPHEEWEIHPVCLDAAGELRADRRPDPLNSHFKGACPEVLGRTAGARATLTFDQPAKQGEGA